MRLPDDTSARQALKECERKTRNPKGRPKLTWLKQIRNQIKEMKINYQDIETLTSDRFMWRTLINEGAMSTPSLNTPGPVSAAAHLPTIHYDITHNPFKMQIQHNAVAVRRWCRTGVFNLAVH